MVLSLSSRLRSSGPDLATSCWNASSRARSHRAARPAPHETSLRFAVPPPGGPRSIPRRGGAGCLAKRESLAVQRKSRWDAGAHRARYREPCAQQLHRRHLRRQRLHQRPYENNMPTWAPSGAPCCDGTVRDVGSGPRPSASSSSTERQFTLRPEGACHPREHRAQQGVFTPGRGGRCSG